MHGRTSIGLGAVASEANRALCGRRHQPARRRAVSLVEVMIAIGIVGLLLSLLLPAVQAAREAGRRSQCATNLRQLGIGLHLYHDAHRSFPPAVVWAPAGEPRGEGLAPPGVFDRVTAGVASATEPDRVFANWTIMLLPFIEEQPLHERYDSSVPLAGPANEAVRSAEVELLKCPSDAASMTDNHFQRSGLAVRDRGYARTNYALNAGPNERCLAGVSARGSLETCGDGFQVNGSNLRTNTSQMWGSGIGGLNRSFRLGDIVSGTSRMVALEEIRAGFHELDRRGVWALGFAGASITAAHGVKGSGGPNAGFDVIQGCREVIQRTGDPLLQGMPCRGRQNPARDISDRATARSHHYLGVHALMADGSTQFISNEIEPRLWEQIHKRNNRVPLAQEFE